MKRLDNQFELKINYIPILGIFIFAFLFIISANLYPGGSQADPNTVGYDWINNYWCNNMSEKSINGKINPGRKYAISGMVILCSSLIVFFYQFSKTFVTDKKWSSAIIIAGVGSMISATLIFSQYHDLMTTISSLFGLVIVVGIIKEIYQSDLSAYKVTGGVCLLLLLINNLIYYTSYKIEWLPIIQKISFLIVLAWVVGLNFEIRKRLLEN